MIRSRRRAQAWLTLVLLASLPASADEWHLELDAEETRIALELGATLHTVRGTAQLREGRLVLDRETGRVSGSIVIDAASLETGNDRRDRVMHTKVLRSDDFPEIRLEPRQFHGELSFSGSSSVTIEGVFTLHGTEHEVKLDVSTRVAGETLEASLEFDVPFVAWGLTDPSRAFLRVEKVVRARVETTGRLIEAHEGPP